MRRTVFLAVLALFSALSARGDDATKARVGRYFTEWYSVCPGNKVTVTAVPEVAILGYDAYRAERACEFKNRNESNLTLVDKAGKEIFVGQVLHDDTRRDRPFVAATDLADDHHHRAGILQRGVNGNAGVAGAGAARHHTHTWLAGQLAVGFRHVSRAAFVAGADQRDFVGDIDERVENPCALTFPACEPICKCHDPPDARPDGT